MGGGREYHDPYLPVSRKKDEAVKKDCVLAGDNLGNATGYPGGAKSVR